MNFLVDNCLPPKIARALHALEEGTGHSIHALRDLFPENAPDLTWIPGLKGVHGGPWGIVTFDRQFNVARERAAIREQGHVAFFLTAGWESLNRYEIVIGLFRSWPRIVEEAERARPGTGFLVRMRGAGFRRFAL